MVIPEAKTLFLSRQGHPTIAHRFNGGAVPQPRQPVPSGAKDPSRRGPLTTRRAAISVAPDGAGDSPDCVSHRSSGGRFSAVPGGTKKTAAPTHLSNDSRIPCVSHLGSPGLATSATGRFRFVKVGDTVFPSRASVRGSSIRDTVELLFSNRPATHRSTQVNVLSWCSHPGDEVGWVHFRFAGIRESRRPVPRQEAVLRSRMSPCRSIFTTPVCVG